MYKYWERILLLHNISFNKQDLEDLVQNNELIYNHLRYNLIPKSVYSGGGKIIYNYKNEQIVFFKSVDEYSTIYSIKELNNNEKMDCVLIIIEKDQKQAIIQNLSNYETCFSANKNKLNGSIMLDIAIDFIKSLKSRYSLTKIVLTDNSNKSCKNGNKIKLSKLYIMTSGHTWYGSRGFVPFDKRNDKNNYNEILLNNYKNNILLFKTLKVKHVKKIFINKLQKYLSSEKIINDSIKTMNNNPDLLFGYFLKYFLRNYSENCSIFSKFYEELFHDLGYNDFYSISFRIYI